MQKQATDSLFKGLDRFGLAPVLLLGLAYVGHTTVVQPIAKSYSAMVDKVTETNAIIKDEITKNNLEDTQRVAAISAAQTLNQQLAEENRALNTRIIEALATADTARKDIHSETREVLERVLKALDKGEQK
jgi:formiminotetrahydrofolate cyclodeaminase